MNAIATIIFVIVGALWVLVFATKGATSDRVLNIAIYAVPAAGALLALILIGAWALGFDMSLGWEHTQTKQEYAASFHSAYYTKE
ncbi:hypothetical protein M0D69_13870 [Caballeronia sp. SEWSISQ10-4 2]|uniref:hypothetical protein n=1 Tax=Caballeronia sp. SEWSISQ10-4 2 TaxID=2937438 RepID=UPI00265524FD|nr:hypothetical protein [Caballeronia sp. SEWSISQ10-4 2]MDN7179081.1 hypothetical protein [Caballeronia sp. SEWSISQ10-4 2]